MRRWIDTWRYYLRSILRGNLVFAWDNAPSMLQTTPFHDIMKNNLPPLTKREAIKALVKMQFGLARFQKMVVLEHDRRTIPLKPYSMTPEAALDALLSSLRSRR